jgi:sialate O-acetylesterase
MIGDNPDWKNPEYDDNKWENIYVPGAWENQGFHGYDGYAWYRKTLIIPNVTERTNYYLDLGYIDDVDQAYINGNPIGKTGSFPPDYSTAYRAHRLYSIPNDLFNETNKITIAIRVYDEIGEGGIISGNIGIWYDKFSLFPDLDLKGEWKFRPGRCSDPRDIQWKYDTWNDIHVPGAWEEQGYKNLDGVACYAKQFSLNGQFDGKRMVLLAGKIDDLDMVYINGKLVGQSGDFLPSTLDQRRDQYRLLRGYYLPDDVLNQNGKNIIVIRVLDVMGQGGIWEGPVGLITQENYIQYWRKKRNSSF